jgi:integrase
LTETLELVRTGRFVHQSNRTVRGFLVDEWLPSVRPPALRPSTWSTYRRHIEAYIVPALGNVQLQRLTPAQVSAFYASLRERPLRRGVRKSDKATKKLSDKTIKNTHAVLRRALRDALRWGYVVRNVVEVVDPPKAKRAEMQVWTPEQLRTFLAGLRDDRLFALWMLAATTGLRRGELAGVRWMDVDLDAGRLAVRAPRVVTDDGIHTSEPKTARGRRVVSLDASTVAALKDWKAAQEKERQVVGSGYTDSGLVFTLLDDEPIKPQAFSRWFQAHALRLGLPVIRLHDIRHSYASAALAAGIPAKVVSERLGHATVSITLDTYSHVLPGMDAQAADLVAKLILGDDHDSPNGSGEAR